MTSKATPSPRVTPSRSENRGAAADKRVTPIGKSPLKLRNLCSVTPPSSRATPNKTERTESDAQLEARIRCQLRLDMLLRMREMQDYYETKIADITEQMDSESFTLSAVDDINNNQEVVDQKTKQEIEKLKQQIAEAQTLKEELAKRLEAQKHQKEAVSQEIENEQTINSKLIEQKNGLQMRVDAMKKKIQDDQIKANALKEEQLRKEKLEKEAKEEQTKEKKEAPLKPEKASIPKKAEKTAKKTVTSELKKSTSKSGKENLNGNQTSARASKKETKTTKTAASPAPASSGMSELSKPPYRMKITPQLAHKAKINK